MPLPLGAFAAGAALAAGGIIRGAQVGALDEGPEYIRDGGPDSPIDAVGLFAARQACKVYANEPGALNDRPAAAYEKVCRPFLDNIGYGSGPKYGYPFRGGQCPGVLYVVSYSYNVILTNGQTSTNLSNGTVNALGPIISMQGAGAPAFQTITITTGGGTFQARGGSCPQGCYRNIRITGIVRQDGQADTCGNRPIVYTEPTAPTAPETGPRPFVFSPDFNFDVDVDVDIDGRIIVDIGTGPIVVDPFSGGEDGDGGGGGDTPSPPAPEPGPELPGGNGGFGGDDDFGDPPAGRRWVGCCIRLTGSPISQPPIPNTAPEDVFPQVLGNIRLVCTAAGSRLTDTPVRINARKVCVWEPVAKLNPTAVNVDLLPGFGYTFTPYSVPLEN